MIRRQPAEQLQLLMLSEAADIQTEGEEFGETQNRCL